MTASDYWESPNYTQGAFQLGVLLTWGMRTNGRTAQSIEYHNWNELFRTLPREARDWAAADLEAASHSCPAGLDFGALLERARRLLA